MAPAPAGLYIPGREDPAAEILEQDPLPPIVCKNFVRKPHFSLPISYRIAIGNAFIIAVGAIAGTLITRHLAGQAADLWLILIFAVIGTVFSVSINCWIVTSALRPLHELGNLVDRVKEGNARIDSHLIRESDPDISQLAGALDSLIAQLREKNERLQHLSTGAIKAQEDERNRIARALHDDTGQSLSTLIFTLEHLERNVPESETELKAKLATAGSLAADILKGLRKIIQGLRPSILDDLGLIPAIRWYARSNLEAAGIQVEIHEPEKPLHISDEKTTTLFRITQEGIHNIIRHSKASNAQISLVQKADEVNLRIEDDGQGFQLNHISGKAAENHQWGLIGIQERAALVGGEVLITSEPGCGTLVEVTIPLSP